MNAALDEVSFGYPVYETRDVGLVAVQQFSEVTHARWSLFAGAQQLCLLRGEPSPGLDLWPRGRSLLEASGGGGDGITVTIVAKVVGTMDQMVYGIDYRVYPPRRLRGWRFSYKQGGPGDHDNRLY